MKRKSTARFLELDLVRATAIVFMVFTHVAMYSYDYSNEFWNSMSDLGGWICLTLFVFTSGASLPIFIEHHGHRIAAEKLIFRGWIFFAISLLFSIAQTGFTRITDVITLQYVADFADFILAFAFIFWLGAICVGLLALLHKYLPQHKLFSKSVNKLSVITTLGFVLLYIGAYYLYFVPVDDSVAVYKALFVGHGELHRFGILQYALIYRLGTIYTVFRHQLTWPILLILGLLGTLIYPYASAELAPHRWSANPTFLLFGLICIAVILAAGRLLAELKILTTQRQTLTVNLSKAAGGILIIHLIIVLLIEVFLPNRLAWAPTVLLFLITLGTSFLVGKYFRI